MKSLCLNQGKSSDVYKWGDQHVLKLFSSPHYRNDARREAHVTQLVGQTGFYVPQVVAITEWQSCPGIVYEYIDGQTLLQKLGPHLWQAFQAAWQFADLHVEMHQYSQPMLPDLRPQLRRMIQSASPLSSWLKSMAIHALDQLSDGTSVCHGDYHFANILMSHRGPIVIDWPNACQGDRLADVARASLVLRYASIPSYIPRSMRWRFASIRTWLNRIYLWRYYALSPFERTRLEAWMLPVAAARLSEQLPKSEIKRVVALVHQLTQGTSRQKEQIYPFRAMVGEGRV